MTSARKRQAVLLCGTSGHEALGITAATIEEHVDELAAATAATVVTAAIIQAFRLRVSEAVADAYVSLHRLGLEDGQIVALLGLPAETPHQVGTQAPEAA